MIESDIDGICLGVISSDDINDAYDISNGTDEICYRKDNQYAKIKIVCDYEIHEFATLTYSFNDENYSMKLPPLKKGECWYLYVDFGYDVGCWCKLYDEYHCFTSIPKQIKFAVYLKFSVCVNFLLYQFSSSQ